MTLGILPRKQNLFANNIDSSQILDPFRGHSTVFLSKHRAKEKIGEFSINSQREGVRCKDHKSALGKTVQKEEDSTRLHPSVDRQTCQYRNNYQPPTAILRNHFIVELHILEFLLVHQRLLFLISVRLQRLELVLNYLYLMSDSVIGQATFYWSHLYSFLLFKFNSRPIFKTKLTISQSHKYEILCQYQMFLL